MVTFIRFFEKLPMTMNKIISLAAAIIIAASFASSKAIAQEASQAPAGPEIEYCLTLHVSLGQAYSVGQTVKGTRTIIPITGGTFEGNLPGKELKGEIIPGGADYQMSNNGRTEVEAIYCIKTDDGVVIHVRNCGIISMGDGFYFRCAPKFEAPVESKYNWMNNSLFLCQPDFSGPQGGITLNVWRVK